MTLVSPLEQDAANRKKNKNNSSKLYFLLFTSILFLVGFIITLSLYLNGNTKSNDIESNDFNNETLKPYWQQNVQLISPSYKVSSFNTLRQTFLKLSDDFEYVNYTKFVATDENSTLNEWRYWYSASPFDKYIDLKNAFLNTNISIIWSLRGGRNSAELLEYFDEIIKLNRKIYFIGFSDNTALHYFFDNFYSSYIRSIHALVASQVIQQTQLLNYIELKDLLNGRPIRINDLKALNKQAEDTQLISDTRVLGGNLALTRRSIKTKWQPNFLNKIVILEEVGETINQTLEFIRNINDNGLFKECKAIVFGQIYNTPYYMNKNEIKSDKEQLIDLVNYYNRQSYLNLTIDFNGQSFNNILEYYYLDLESKIGLEELPSSTKKLIIAYDGIYDSVTRLETSLLHLYQSKYLNNSIELIISYRNIKPQDEPDESQDEFLRALKEISKKIVNSNGKQIPVFKSESFGHLALNRPIPFNTNAKIVKLDNNNYLFEIDSF